MHGCLIYQAFIFTWENSHVLFLRPIGIYLFPSNTLDSFNIHREEEIDRRKREVVAEGKHVKK
jgi:hypothetical protein